MSTRHAPRPGPQPGALASALAKVGDLPCVGAVLYAQVVSS